MTWRNAEGISSELQLTRKDAWETKLWSDGIYDKWRNVVDVEALSPEEYEQYMKDKTESNARWNQLALPDFSMYERSSSAERTRAFQSSSNETGLDGLTQAPSINSSTRASELGSVANVTTRPDSVIAGGVYPSIESSPSTDIIQQAEEGDKTKYSLPAVDTQYLRAVESNDLDTAQQLVDQAAEAAMPDSKIRDEDGKLLVVYHGTDQRFTVFDPTKSRANMDIQGAFFSPWELDAEGYGPNVGRYYLDIKNPAPESVGYKALRMFQGQNGAGAKAREYLISQGYDGVNNGNEEYIAFYPEQIKSADPTTHDDAGNVIPLSQRFNPENKDIRYSLPADQIQPNRAVLPVDEQLQQEIGTAVDHALADREAKRQRDLGANERRASNQAINNIALYERRQNNRPTVQDAYTQIFDDLNPLDQITQRTVRERMKLIEEIRKKQAGGQELTAEEQTMMKAGVRGFDSTADPREMMRHKRNVVTNFLEVCLGSYMVDPEGNRVLNKATGANYGGFYDIIKGRVTQSEELEFNQYLADLSTVERMTVDQQKAGVSEVIAMQMQPRIEALQARIARTEAMHPEWNAVSLEMSQWFRQFMQTWLVDRGHMRQSTLDNFAALYPHYVPLFEQRTSTKLPNGLTPEESGQVGTNKLRSRKGMKDATYQNPVVSMVGLMQQYMEFEKQAEAYRAFAAAMSSPDAQATGWAERVNDVGKVLGNQSIDQAMQNGPGAIENLSGFSWWTQNTDGESILNVPISRIRFSQQA